MFEADSIKVDLSLSARSLYTAYYKEALYIPEADEVVAIAALLSLGGQDISVASLLMLLSDYGWGLWEEELRCLATNHIATNHTVPSWFVSSLRGGMRTELVLCGYALNPRLGELFGVGCNPWSRIQRLVLSSNPLGCQGCAGLAVGLASPENTLREVVLDKCDIGDRGAAALAAAVRAPTCAVWLLQLEENEIGDPGAMALAAALSASSPRPCRQHHPLQLLLGGNCIGVQGCDALKAAHEARNCGSLTLTSRFFPQQRPPTTAGSNNGIVSSSVWRSYATRSKRVEPLHEGYNRGRRGNLNLNSNARRRNQRGAS